MTDLPPAQEPFGSGDMPTSTTPTPSGENDKLFAGLSYISQFIVPLVLPLILLFTEEGKRSAYVRYHAIQSLGLLAVSIVYELVATIVFIIVSAILPCLSCVAWLLFLVPVAPLVYYGILAFQGKEFEIPYLTVFMRKQGWL